MAKSKTKMQAQRKKRLSRVESPGKTKSSGHTGLIPASLARRAMRAEASPQVPVEKEVQTWQRQMEEDAPVQSLAEGQDNAEREPAGVQRLTVSRVDDPSEREAESVARQVAAGEKAPPISPMPAEETSQRLSRMDDEGFAERQAEPEPSAAIQRQVDSEIKEPAVQRRADETEIQRLAHESTIQRQADETDVHRDATDATTAEPMQRQATNNEAGMDTETAARAMQSSGQGRPMQTAMREKLESGMRADLSEVRIHDDSAARQASDALNARAFARGDDIFMGAGASENDVSLMAHEAAHTVQQSGGTARKQIQRAGNATVVEPANDQSSAGSDRVYDGPEGKINTSQKTIVLPLIRVPQFKGRFIKAPLRLPKEERGNTPQVRIWEANAKGGTAVDAAIERKLQQEHAPEMESGGKKIYYLKLKKVQNFVIGDIPAIKNSVVRPYWDRQGERIFYDVDHKNEVQTGGDPEAISNLWLLNAGANRSSGSLIKNEIDRRISTLLTAARSRLGAASPRDVGRTKQRYDITVAAVRPDMKVGGRGPFRSYELSGIKSGVQLHGLRVLSGSQIKRAGLKGDATELAIFTNPAGGGIKRIKWGEGSSPREVKRPWLPNYKLTNVHFELDGSDNWVEGTAFDASGKVDSIPGVRFPIDAMEGVPFGGSVRQSSVARAVSMKLKAKGASPVEVTEAGIDPAQGIYAKGKLLPTIPLIADLDIDIEVRGNDIFLSKTITADEFSLPGPITVTSSALTLRAGRGGVGAAGQVDFEIERLGNGMIRAAASAQRGGTFALEGSFDFDSTLFDPATVSLKYVDGKFSGGGELGIKEGKIKGIKSATITANVEGERWSASGTVQPSIPGVEQGTLSLEYDPESGMEIAGSLSLTNEIPGIRGGTMEAAIKQREGGEGWKLKASGNAQLDIPGIDSSIAVTYDDGAFSAAGILSYERGLLSGLVMVGVTNMAVGEDGQPQGEPTDTLSFFGKGALTITFSPWLKGTAGVTFMPDGQMEVVGEIGIPATVDVFPEKRFDKELLSIGIDLPIFGVTVPVIRKNIGIFLSINGDLTLSAGVGPGQLRELSLGVTYNPDKEEDTRIVGSGKFVVPADAGLRLAISAALGAGIPVIEAKAGLEIGGQLGVEGAAEASVEVNWTPSTGIVLDAAAEVHAEPKFRFDVTGFVLVEADVGFWSYTLYEERWELAKKEFGSGLTLGLKMPIHYEQGQPFEPSLEDIEIQKPDINPRKVLGDLFDAIT